MQAFEQLIKILQVGISDSFLGTLEQGQPHASQEGLGKHFQGSNISVEF